MRYIIDCPETGLRVSAMGAVQEVVKPVDNKEDIIVPYIPVKLFWHPSGAVIGYKRDNGSIKEIHIIAATKDERIGAFNKRCKTLLSLMFPTGLVMKE